MNQCRTNSGGPSPFRWASRRTAKRSTAALSSNQVCAAGWHSVCTKRSRRAFPRARSGRTIARRRTNLTRQVSSRAHFAWLRVRGARARAVRTRRILRPSQPTILQDRSIHYMYDRYPFPARFALPRDDSRPNTGIYPRYGTYPVCTGMYQGRLFCTRYGGCHSIRSV